MKKKILRLFILFLFSMLFPLLLFCQDNTKAYTNDTIYFGITNYPFTYDTKLNTGSIAIGPSVFLNNRRLTVQIGALYDFKTYVYFEQSTHLQTDIVKKTNLFFPILFHYSYYRSNKINCFVSSGCILGGPYYVDEDNRTKMTSPISIIGGIGISYNIIKKINVRVSPSLRYSIDKFFPGLFVDLLYSFRIKVDKNK